MEHKITRRDKYALFTLNGTDKELNFQSFIYLCKCQPDHRRGFRQLQLDHFHSALAEHLKPCSSREHKSVCNISCGIKLRVDYQCKTKVILDYIYLVVILRISYSAYSFFRTKLSGEHTAHHIQLIVGSCCNKQVGIFNACIYLYRSGSAVALDTHYILRIEQLFNSLRVIIDSDNVMPLLNELFGKRSADLTRTDNYKSHNISMP